MSMLQIAMMGKLPYTALKEAIFAHPTLAEGLNNVFWRWTAKAEVVPAPDRSPRQSSGGNDANCKLRLRRRHDKSGIAKAISPSAVLNGRRTLL